MTSVSGRHTVSKHAMCQDQEPYLTPQRIPTPLTWNSIPSCLSVREEENVDQGTRIKSGGQKHTRHFGHAANKLPDMVVNVGTS